MKRLIQILWLLLLLLNTSGACWQSDVATCCLAACQVRNGPHWDRADQVLRSCAKASGCSGVDHWTTAERCDCGRAER